MRRLWPLMLLGFTSCAMFPNTSAAVESMPEECWTSIWLLAEGIVMDTWGLAEQLLDIVL